MSENCDNCGQHAKDCTCWVRDDFIERCRRAELFIGLLLRMESSPRILISVFITEIQRIMREDSNSALEYEDKMRQVTKVLQGTISD